MGTRCLQMALMTHVPPAIPPDSRRECSGRNCHSLEDFSRTLSCSARGGVRSVISTVEPSLYDEMSKIGQRFQNGANH